MAKGGLNYMVIICPTISKELLDYLDMIFPDRAPETDCPDRKVWINVGSALVGRHLRSQFVEQNETILENPIRR